jgi:hypothetical protein
VKAFLQLCGAAGEGIEGVRSAGVSGRLRWGRCRGAGAVVL